MRRTPTDAELEDIAQRRGWPLPMVIELVKGSAISEQVLVDAKVHFVVDPKAASKRFGRPAKEWESRVPAWFVPYYIPFHDDPVIERAKPTKPFVFKETKDDGTVVEKTQKYAQRKDSGVHIYFGPSLLSDGPARTDANKLIIITEGEKKALACESAGVACLGLGGVSNWHRKGEKTLHPSFAWIESWEGREVGIAFDRDSIENAQVRIQELELGRKLEAKGAKVFLIRFPEDAGKMDDYLATHEVTEFHQLIEHFKENNKLPPDTSTVTGAPAPATALTDMGNAERMLKLHGDDLRYCEAIGAWFRWTGKRWERDTTQGVMRRAMATVRTIYAEADAATDVDQRMKLRQHAQHSESHARISATVKLLSVMASISVRPEQFDADPWLITCENGTVDLRTGVLRAHRREDLVTRVAPVKYDPKASHDLWIKFLMEATGGDLDMISYLQRAVGYSLTGSTREDKLFFIYGPGGRGKGTFVNAILAPLGEYARVADISSFIERKDGGGGDKPRPDLVRLMGARIALCDEVKRDARLDEGLVKTITGGSPLSVRTLNKEGFEMVPTFKMWLVANDPPIIHAEDTGMWRRMVRIPFTHAPSQPDTQLRDTLKSDPAVRAAVFAWAVAGVQHWLEHGLKEPKVILESNAAYHAEMDPVGEFFARNCRFVEVEYGRTVATPRRELRKAYEEWCKEEGHSAVQARRFTARMKEAMRAHGFDPKHAGTTVRDRDDMTKVRDAWKWVRLLEDREREDQSDPTQGEVGSVEGSSPIGKLIAITNLHHTTIANDSYVPTVPTSLQEQVRYREDRGNPATGAVGTSNGVGTQNSLLDENEPESDVEW